MLMCMGRKRIDQNEKKIVVSLSIKKKYIDELKDRGVNVSNLVEDLIKNYLGR
jgi:post-segregation antitoxin (ccd killing protein)